MSEQAAERVGADGPDDAFREELLLKMANWIDELGSDADVAIFGTSEGLVTPRDIFNQVRDRDPVGEAYVRSYWELEREAKRLQAGCGE